MAQMDGLRYVENPTGEQLQHSGDEAQGHWLVAPMTPTFGKNYDHEDEHDHHHGKKSVLAKVKEKAKKWRQTLAKKKHGHDGSEGSHYTPAWGVRLDEDDEDEDQDPEYHGAPMYESEMAPDSYKDAAQHQPKARKQKASRRPNALAPPALERLDSLKERDIDLRQAKTPAAADKHALEAKVADGDPTAKNGSNKTLTETVSDMLAPAYSMVTEAAHAITSKIQSPAAASGEESVSKQMWDKGISVKEYLMQKLEPGEDEKALSQVISEAMSPRKAGNAGEMGVGEKVITLSEVISEAISPRKTGSSTGELGVVEKVKGAVTSILGKEEPPPPIDSRAPATTSTLQPNPVSTDTRPRSLSSVMSQPLPVSENPQVLLVSTKSQPIPLSSNPHAVPVSNISQTSPVPNIPYADEIQEEESGGRILQAYTN